MNTIVFAVHTYYPQSNGVQFVTEYMAEGLAAKGYKVVVVTNQIEGASEREEHRGVTIHRIRIEGRFGHRFRGDRRKYYRLLEEYRPQVLVAVCTQSWPFDWTVLRMGRLKCRTILYTHGYSEYREHYGIIEKFLQGHILTAKYMLGSKLYYGAAPYFIRKFDLVIYITKNEEAYRLAEKKGLKNGKVLANGVEDRIWEFGSQERQEHSDRGRKVKLLNVGNYGEVKDQRRLLEIFYEIQIDDLELHFVGSEENQYYRELCQRKKRLDRVKGTRMVEMHCGLDRTEVLQLFQEADIYVMTSRWEAFSVSLCEAAAAGLPLVGTRVGNAEEFDGMILCGTDEEFCRAIEELAKNPEERRRRGRKLQAFASANCRIRDKVDWMDSEIRSLLGNGSGGKRLGQEREK